MLSDAELVGAAQAGDRGALETLLGRHYERVYAVCRRLVGNDADAADAAQDTMIAVVRGLHRFDGRSAFATWAYRIATNASLDELRRRRRRPMVSSESGVAADVDDPAALGALDTVDQRLQLDRALEQLPPDFRTAVVLRDVADLDYAEIAAALDLPIGTVKSRIARGRAALATILGRWDGNPAPGDERPSDRR
jgi:RNA polymerase sigma-70 factor, ECF subfamily